MTFIELRRTVFAELKANPRLRWGAWAIFFILGSYGALELRDGVKRQNDAYRALVRNIARLQETATQTEWLVRLNDAQALQAKLENGLWQEGTIGLAQATIQEWLTQVTQQSGLAKVQMAVSAHEEEAGGRKNPEGTDNDRPPLATSLWKVSARLTFDFAPQTFYPLLKRITMHPKKVTVESLTIQSAPSPRADLRLVAYFQKPGGEPVKPQQGKR